MEVIRVRLTEDCQEMMEDIARSLEGGGEIALLGASAQSLSNLLGGSAQLGEMLPLDGGVGDRSTCVDLSVLTDEMLAPEQLREDVRYFVLKPIDLHTFRRYACVDAWDERSEALRKQVESLCFKLGIPGNIKGFGFICEAVVMVVQRPALIGRITKELYPSIAARHGTSYSKVERSIRHAVSRLWKHGQAGRINELFGFAVCDQDRRLPNGEFIALLASRYKGYV